MIGTSMDAEGFTLESLLQSFSLAASQAEKRVEGAQGSRSLLIESISVDLDLMRKPNDLFGFSASDDFKIVKCKITKIAGQNAKLLIEDIEGIKHV